MVAGSPAILEATHLRPTREVTAPMRPLLLPSLRRLWRDSSTLQLGVDPCRAVVLCDVGASTTALLDLLDGRRTLDEVVAGSRPLGVPAEVVAALVGQLARCGAVVDGSPAAGLERRLSVAGHQRLEPDLQALSLTAGADAGRHLAARGRRRVLVRSTGRVGPVLAALLAASGVGRVSVAGHGTVTADETAVGGLLPDDVRRPYALAAADAVRRAAPETDTRLHDPGAADVVVLVGGPGPAPPERLRWVTLGVPHLPVVHRDGAALIGPLVIPGLTACLDCVELHRADRDPAWPALAAQLATAPAGTVEASHSAIATAAGALAAMQVLCHLDGGEPEALGATLELTELGAGLRRRPWSPHPRCGCLRTPLRPPA